MLDHPEGGQCACEHTLCDECAYVLGGGSGVPELRDCIHHTGGQSLPTPVPELSRGIDGSDGRDRVTPNRHVEPALPADAMVTCLPALADRITSVDDRATSFSAARSHLKTTQAIEFPKGSDEALEDIDGW